MRPYRRDALRLVDELNRDIRARFSRNLQRDPALARLWRRVFACRRYTKRHGQARRMYYEGRFWNEKEMPPIQ